MSWEAVPRQRRPSRWRWKPLVRNLKSLYSCAASAICRQKHVERPGAENQRNLAYVAQICENTNDNIGSNSSQKQACERCSAPYSSA